MKRRTTILLALMCGALSALTLAAGASAARFSGVVVHKNSRAHSFVIAARSGRLTAMHSRHTPALGHAATVLAQRLRNGTWSAQHVTLGRVSRHVRLRGTVTYVNARRHLFVVSARGVSLIVHERRARLHRAFASSDSQPATGEVVTVDGTVDGNSVDASQVEQNGQNRNGVDLEGTVQAIDTTGRTLSISADDSEQSGAALTVLVPASFDLSLFSVNQSVQLIVSPNADGTYTLQQSSNDSNAQQANNPGDSQGDGQGDQRPNAEQQCAAQQSDPNFPAGHNGMSFTQFYETNLNEPADALGRCVDAMAHGDGSNPSPEMQCHMQQSDPSFAATHNGLSFAQFYDPQDPTNLGDAYGRCVDTTAHQNHGESGSGGQASGGSGPND